MDSTRKPILFLHENLDSYEVRNHIRKQDIQLAGNRQLKIYGHLKCSSGKRMKQKNRIFFKSEDIAQQHGYRPCAHCMPKQYKKWKNEII